MRQELIWFRSSENTFFSCSWFFFCVCPLRSWYILENLIYDEQKWRIVRRFIAVTQLEKLLTKYHIFHFLIQKLRGSKQKYGLRTLALGITQVTSSSWKMMLSVVIISIKIIFKSTWNKNYFGVSQREETYVARASEKLNYFFESTMNTSISEST